MRIRFLSHFDFLLLFAVIALMTIGILFIYSSGINAEGVLVSNEYIKQIVFASVGLLIMLAVTFFDYRKFSAWATYLFITALAVLVYTRIFGRYVNGARSWLGFGIFGIQPSEFTKIAFILFFAKYLEKSEKNEGERRRFIKALVIMLFPVLLILLQPDLGTASVYFPIFLAMCFAANIPLRYICMVFLCGAFTIVFTVLPYWQESILKQSVPFINILTDDRLRLITIISLGSITLISLIGNLLLKNKYFYWISYIFGIITVAFLASVAAGKVLKEYQVMRLIVFLDPSVDPLNSGWNIIQSITAIGSGGEFGRGFLNGTQSHYRFLPQQSTDFIFSILAEEWGFFGGIIVFLLFAVILIRGLFIIKETTNAYGFYIATGIIAMVFFHFIVNIGMVMGIMPITGIPLLFLSYGGSSLWTALIAIGLLMSIHIRKLDY